MGQSPFSNSHPIAQYLQALKSFYRFGLTHFQNSNIISQLEQVSTKKGKPECNFKYRDIRTAVNWSDFWGNPRDLREQGNMLIYLQDKGYFWDKYGGTRDLSKGTLTGPPISLGEIYPYQSSSKWPPVEGRLPEPNIEWLWLLSDRKRRSAAKTGWIIMYNRITRILTINSRRSKLSKNNCQLWLKNWQFHFTKTTITDSGLADHHFKILSSWKYGATFIITWLIVVSEND